MAGHLAFGKGGREAACAEEVVAQNHQPAREVMCNKKSAKIRSDVLFFKVQRIREWTKLVNCVYPEEQGGGQFNFRETKVPGKSGVGKGMRSKNRGWRKGKGGGKKYPPLKRV
jgi:hypothetical protein